MILQEKIKIIAIIDNHNGGFAYVLNRDIGYDYTKIDKDTIIGKDEGVLKFYERDNRIYPFGKTAFGGREFTLKLSDGTEEKCHGQWWDGMSKTARELYSYDNLVDFPSATIDDLQKYYLFYGRYCDKKWLEELKAEYKGRIYDYYEYQNIVKNQLNQDIARIIQ